MSEISDIGAMLADVLPEGGHVTAKNPAVCSDELMARVCPYARITIWLDATDCNAFVDGATFCANVCETGACEVEPGRAREQALRAYVARRVREWRMIRKQDTGIAERRIRLEKTGALILHEVDTRAIPGGVA
jgi:hypothetical protein